MYRKVHYVPAILTQIILYKTLKKQQEKTMMTGCLCNKLHLPPDNSSAKTKTLHRLSDLMLKKKKSYLMLKISEGLAISYPNPNPSLLVSDH